MISFTTADPSAMISETSRVCFDLDGQGNVGPWPWPRPDTALLVWDPDRRGAVESGRDLLGEGSFGLFPRDGFAALSMLDDDHDGWVTHGELDGLRLWFDRDCDGESQRDETHDLNEFGVVALCCADGQSTDVGLVHPEGVLLRSGRRLPLVDWIASSHSETRR